LWNLFESIDRDGNGKLDKDELMSAFKNAGLSVSETKMQRFMDEIDSNHDGCVDFAEWRFVIFPIARHFTSTPADECEPLSSHPTGKPQ
jgi:solute carrier family 25 phosphate transporter 23/24/25/41